MIVTPSDCFLQFSIRRNLEYFDSEDAVMEAEGKIYYAKDDGTSELIGVVEGVVFGASAGWSRWDMYDAIGHTFEYYEGYVAPYIESDEHDGAMKLEGVDKWIEVPMNPNVCAVTFMGIAPNWRGSGLGLSVIKEFLLTFGADKCGAAILKPCPQTFDFDRLKKGDYPSFSDLFKTENGGDTKRLAAYYSKLGFRKIVGTELMFLNLEYRRDW
ncbi:MAG: hypothetical protein JEY79_19285 [Pseudodesulfovibrio sp.]|nr:hypothetical protein [Pseudodesulfovibrio sp.]